MSGEDRRAARSVRCPRHILIPSYSENLMIMMEIMMIMIMIKMMMIMKAIWLFVPFTAFFCHFSLQEPIGFSLIAAPQR